MTERQKGAFSLNKNLIQVEFLLDRENMKDINADIVFGNILFNKDDISPCKDIAKLINTTSTFPNVIAESADKKSTYVFISVTKKIPSELKKRMLFIPRDTIAVTMMDICENQERYDCSFLLTIDNYGELIIVSEDSRFVKKQYKRWRKIPEIIIKTCTENIKGYFFIFNSLLESEYILSYQYKDNTVFFPLIGENVKYLFKDREKAGERRKPIPYGVNEYQNKRGITFMSHMRGVSEFKQGGREFGLMVGEKKWKQYQKERTVVNMCNGLDGSCNAEDGNTKILIKEF